MKNLMLSCLLLLSNLFLFGQKDIPVCVLADQPPQIDGKTADWPEKFPYYDKGNKVNYLISNDDRNIYLCIRTYDPVSQQKIMRAGVTIQFTAGTKGRNKATITYPMKAQLASATPSPNASSGQQPRQGGRASSRDEVIKQCTDMKVKGLASLNGTVPVKNDAGVKAAFSWEAERLLSYEMAVPLSELFGSELNEENLEAPIEVRITILPVIQAKPGGTGVSSGGGGGRGGGGRGGGSRGGGSTPARGGSGGTSEMQFQTLIKHNTTLNPGISK